VTVRRTGSLRGRADQLADILRFVNDDRVNLVTLTGRGGVGKTALAREVARELRGLDPARDVTFVELDTVSDAEDVIRRIAGELGLMPMAGDVTESVAARLGQSTSVLVIDNMEHVLDAAVELSELLDRCPALTALVTSQWPLQLRGEQVVRVMPLELPESDVDPAALLVNPAVAIYCDRAREMDHRFDPDDAAVRAIAQLCRRLDGLPLAIELAAASSVSLPAKGLMDRLDERPLGVLCGRLQDVPPRHRDLRGAIQWTLDLLRPRQQVLLARLSIVNGRFPLDVVESLSDRPEDALDDLAVLVDLHLVEPQSDIDEPWFRLHPTIRAFATERLRESGDRSATVERHVAGAASWARGAGAACEATGRVGDLCLRRDDLTACVHLALGTDLVVSAIDLVLGMAPMWLATGYGGQEVAMVEAVLERARREGVESAALASFLSWSVRLDAELRADVCTRTHAERLVEAESMARRCADRDAKLRVLAAEVFVARLSGDRASANTAARDGLRAAVDVGDDVWVASFEMWVGMLSHMDQDLERATTYGRRALDRARRVGDVRTEILATVLLRDLALRCPTAADGTESTATLIDLARRSGQQVVAGIIAPTRRSETVTSVSRQTASKGCWLRRTIRPRSRWA
jgi:predicted ATPase